MLVKDLLHKDANNLNLFRLILASMVIYGHAPCFINATGRTDFIANLVHFTYSGNLAVIMFFFISGILITNSLLVKQNWKSFILARLFRLIPGLIFVSAVIGIICFYFTESNFITHLKIIWEYMYKNALLNIQFEMQGVNFLHDAHPLGGRYAAAINGSLWTIPIEFKMYLMILSVWFISKSIYPKLMPVLMIIGLLSPIIFIEPLLGDGEVKFLIPSFMLGALYAYYKDKINLNWQVAIGLFLLTNIVAGLIIKSWLYVVAFNTTMIWLSGTKLLTSFRIKHDISYGVYLWGWPIEQLVGYFMPWLHYWYFILVSIALTFVVAYISCRLIEEPSMNICKKIHKYEVLHVR